MHEINILIRSEVSVSVYLLVNPVTEAAFCRIVGWLLRC